VSRVKTGKNKYVTLQSQRFHIFCATLFLPILRRMTRQKSIAKFPPFAINFMLAPYFISKISTKSRVSSFFPRICNFEKRKKICNRSRATVADFFGTSPKVCRANISSSKRSVEAPQLIWRAKQKLGTPGRLHQFSDFLSSLMGHAEVVPIVRTGNSGFLACLFPYQAAFSNPCS
jgi:hypothetical protein